MHKIETSNVVRNYAAALSSRQKGSIGIFEVGRSHSVLPPDVREELNKAVPIMRELVLQAGQSMRDYRAKGKVSFELKLDRSKVTKADKEIQKLIVERLTNEFPTFGVIAEEELEDKALLTNSSNPILGFSFVIDPIDGTERFRDPKEKYFGCGIALMYNGEVIASTFYAPDYNVSGFVSDKWSGSLFEASELCDGVFLNEKEIHLDPEKDNFNNSTVVLEDIKEQGLDPNSFKTIHNTGSDLLTLSLISSGLDGTPVVLANGGWAGSGGAHLWDVVGGAYFIEKAGGVAWNRNGDNFFPLTNIAFHDGQPIYNGEYFAGYPNAIKQLLDLKN